MFAIQIKRFFANENCTVGRMFVNGVYQCLTLEDKVREVPGDSVQVWKVPGKTAIPSGTYDLTIDLSTRFKRLMPHILNVPGFDGIRIHSGNTDADTEGCILLGIIWNEYRPDWISESRMAFDAFYARLQDAIENVGEHPTVTITNEFPAAVSAEALN